MLPRWLPWSCPPPPGPLRSRCSRTPLHSVPIVLWESAFSVHPQDLHYDSRAACPDPILTDSPRSLDPPEPPRDPPSILAGRVHHPSLRAQLPQPCRWVPFSLSKGPSSPPQGQPQAFPARLTQGPLKLSPISPNRKVLRLGRGGGVS